MKIAMIALGAALALCACGPRAQTNSNGSVTVHDAAGQAVTIGRQLPSNMPAYAPIFAGASVVSTLNSSNGGMVAYTVQATPDAIIDFYKKAATGAQLTSQFDSSAMSSSDGAHRVIMFGQQGTKRSLSVTVETQPGGVSKVALLYGAA